MGDIDQNIEVWRAWDWSREGEEWSDRWGGTEAMWYGVLLPRVHRFLPAGTIIEIAPGYGRWTQFLKDRCDRLILVDLAENCIEHCRRRFADERHIEYHVNDGRSLRMVEDDSVDFVFSFDSLVHVESDVIDAYVRQLARKLRAEGAGFIHHSNLARYRRLTELSRQLPRRLFRSLHARGIVIDLPAWRAESMSAEIFARQCADAGLSCISQEEISWERGFYMIDALSTFTRAGSRWDRPTRRRRNPLFGLHARRTAALYGGSVGHGAKVESVPRPE